MNNMISLESIEFTFLPLLYLYTFIYTSSIQTKNLIDKFKKKKKLYKILNQCLLFDISKLLAVTIC